MNRKSLSSLVMAIIVYLMAFGMFSQENKEVSEPNALCDKCKMLMVVQDIGTCENCGKETSSSAYKYCKACAITNGACMSCGQRFTVQTNEEKKPVKKDTTFDTSDGVIMHGTIYLPADSTKDDEAKSPLVIMLHQMSMNRKAWQPYATSLQNQGYCIFTYDLRGHGESTTKKNPKDPQKTVDFSWNKMKNEEFKNMITDLKIAIDFIKESNNKDKLNIDTSNIAIIGSSIGANTALNYAAADASVKALVLISPGANYHDITVEDSMKKYGNRPVLLISSKEDKDSYETCEKLEKLSKSEKKENMSIEGKAHGNGILSENKEIGKTIEKWIVGYLHLKPEDTPSEKK